jgi:hypothetical protein
MTATRTGREGQTLEKAGITMDMILEAVQADDCLGFCTACGAEAYGVEPDARRYRCDCCDAFAVYGAEELLLMYA